MGEGIWWKAKNQKYKHAIAVYDATMTVMVVRKSVMPFNYDDVIGRNDNNMLARKHQNRHQRQH